MPPLLKIAIVGPESTGKSSLSEGLAKYYQTNYVPEVARNFLLLQNNKYVENDLLKIAKAQASMEDRVAERTDKILFCDTTLLVIKIWSQVKYNRIDTWIIEEEEKRNYDFYILTAIDLPWEEDPQREHPHLRKYLFDLYESTLISKKVPFAIVSGKGENRLKNAVEIINSQIEHYSH